MASNSSAPTNASNQAPISRKLVLLGESAVGKSSLLFQFVKGQFEDYRESTIGAAFMTQTVTTDKGQKIKLEIWDTAGQERYKSLAPMYYRNAHCALVVYDITSAVSLQKAKTWIAELQRQADPSIVVALAGNKDDLAEEKREVPTQDGEAFAKEEGLIFYEVSAKTGHNVKELFQAIADALPVETKPKATQENVALDKRAAASSSSDCAC